MICQIFFQVRLAKQKREEEERFRAEEADKKAKEAEEKRRRLEEAEKLPRESLVLLEDSISRHVFQIFGRKDFFLLQLCDIVTGMGRMLTATH